MQCDCAILIGEQLNHRTVDVTGEPLWQKCYTRGSKLHSEESVIHILLLKVNSPNEQQSNMLPDLISYVHEQSMNQIALQSKLWQVT